MNTESNPMYNSRRIADLSSSPNLEDLSDLLDASGRSRIHSLDIFHLLLKKL